MKSLILKSNGTIVVTEPKNEIDFSLEEMQAIVGGYVEVVNLKDGRIIVLNEDGKLKHLPLNVQATQLYNMPDDFIVGDVLVCESSKVK